MADSEQSMQPDWKQYGVRIIRSGELDTNTPQTRGMSLVRSSVTVEK